MVGLALDRPPKHAACPPGMGQRAPEMEVMARITRGLVQGGREQQIAGIQTPSNASGARGRATWPGNALPQCQL